MAELTSDVGCSHHNGACCVYICVDCDDNLACVECTTDLHQNHQLENLADFLSERKGVIRQYLDRLSSSKPTTLQKDIEDTDDRLRENSQTFRRIINDIQLQGEQMKSDIDKVTGKLTNLCKDLERNNADVLEALKSSQLKLYEDQKSKEGAIEEVLDSGTPLEIIEFSKECQNIDDTVTSVRKALEIVEFNAREICTGQLEHMLGTLTVNGLDHLYNPTERCTVVSQFQHLTTASTCRVAGDQAWLSYWKEQDIYRVDLQGHVLEKVNCDANVRHFAVSPVTGKLWFCCWEDGTVREITTGDTTLRRIVTDISPMCICVTADHTVIVGMAGEIRMYSTDGLEVSSGGVPCKQLAECPHHVTCCTQTGDVAATDNDGVNFDDYMSRTQPGKQPRVIVMDKYLNRKFLYPDNMDDSHRLLRYPYDVCFDGIGDVLVIDWATNSVLQIDGGRGVFLRTVYTSDVIPHTLSQQVDGTLWVGFVGKSVKVLKYRELATGRSSDKHV